MLTACCIRVMYFFVDVWYHARLLEMQRDEFIMLSRCNLTNACHPSEFNLLTEHFNFPHQRPFDVSDKVLQYGGRCQKLMFYMYQEFCYKEKNTALFESRKTWVRFEIKEYCDEASFDDINLIIFLNWFLLCSEKE